MDSGADETDADTDVVSESPALAGVVVFAVAATAWVGVTVVTGDRVEPLTTGLFAVAFTAVYMAFALFYPG